MFYELWDLRSGNLVNTYDTAEQALVVVRDLLLLNGIDFAHRLSLSVEDDSEEIALVAKGMALAERAQELRDAV